MIDHFVERIDHKVSDTTPMYVLIETALNALASLGFLLSYCLMATAATSGATSACHKLDPIPIFQREKWHSETARGWRGQSITDSACWSSPQVRTRLTNVVAAAENTLETPFLRWDDDAYLEFDRSGQQTWSAAKPRTILAGHPSHFVAEGIEHGGRLLPAIRVVSNQCRERSTGELQGRDDNVQGPHSDDCWTDRWSFLLADQGESRSSGPPIPSDLKPQIAWGENVRARNDDEAVGYSVIIRETKVNSRCEKKAAGSNLKDLLNPIWVSSDNLRDPSVLKAAGGYHVFYSRFSNGNWKSPTNWAVAQAFTHDFVHFEADHDVSPLGCASPGDVIRWGGRWLLPYQTYPATPTHLLFSESTDLTTWSAPKHFLKAAAALPWNKLRRVIDPTLVVDGDTLHCFFVGSENVTNPSGVTHHVNLLGHAITRDPKLTRWEILTTDAPLLGASERAPDGVENVMIFRTGNHWTMIFSEGLANQHLALATSTDLISWRLNSPIELPCQEWMARRYGAPFVWREQDHWRMMLMGENMAGQTTFGLLTSPEGENWTLLPERTFQSGPQE